MADEGRKRKMQRKKGANLIKNLFKKISAILIAAVMVLAMASTAFADGETSKTPSDADLGTITVRGLQPGDSVAIAKIVKANYNKYGVIGYEALYKDDKGAAIPADVQAPTPGEIVKLMNNQSVKFKTPVTVENGKSEVVFNELTVGMYLIKVTPKEGNVTTYNPMIASIKYENANTGDPIPGEVNATSNWVINNEIAYAKSTQNYTPEKVIVKADKESKNDIVKAGESVKFKISGTIPSYSEDYYTDPTYILTDTLSKGLTIKANYAETLKGIINNNVPKVVENQTPDAVDVTIAKDGDNNVITITFKQAYLWKVAKVENREYSFEYEATVNGSEYNLDASTNSVALKYTREPGKKEDATPVKTYHYTFNFNGEVKKVNEKSEALPGAEFQLFTNADCTSKATTVAGNEIKKTSDKDGLFAFSGLDDEIYYLKEVKAPATYQLTDKVYKVQFEDFKYDGDKMTSYTVSVTEVDKKGNTIGESAKTVYTLSNGEAKATSQTITNIQNTKLGTLPSTGGMGTYLFTIIGVVVMAGAAGAFFISRRKGSEE